MTANAGSVTAKKFSQVKDATTVLSGFALPDAAVTANWAATLDDNDLDDAKQSLARFHASINRELDNSDDLNKDQVKVAKDLLSDMLGVAEKTLEGKKVDYALTVLLKPRVHLPGRRPDRRRQSTRQGTEAAGRRGRQGRPRVRQVGETRRRSPRRRPPARRYPAREVQGPQAAVRR